MPAVFNKSLPKKDKNKYAKFLARWFLLPSLGFAVGTFINPLGADFMHDYYLTKLQPRYYPELSDLADQRIAGVNTCAYEVCSNFKDGKWTEDSGLQDVPSGKDQALTLKTVISDTSRGGTRFFKELVSSDSKFKFAFKPLGVQANFTTNIFDIAEFIIGDGNYGRITCKDKITGHYLPFINGAKYYILSEPIKRGTQVDALIIPQAIAGTNKIKLSLVIVKYFGESGREHNNIAIPACIVDSPSDPDTLTGRIGFGLNDWQKTDDISAEFKYFYSQKNLN